MADPYVREVGSLRDSDGVLVSVRVDYDSVTVGHLRFGAGEAEEFAHLFVSACWQAGANKRQMDEEAGDG